MDLTNLSQNDIIIIVGILVIVYLLTMWYLTNSINDKIEEILGSTENFDGLLSNKADWSESRTYDGSSIREDVMQPEDPDGSKSELTELYDFSQKGHIDEGN